MSEVIKFKSDGVKKATRAQAVVEATKPVEGECRVLSVTATPSVRAGEVFAGEVRYGGKVIFDCFLLCDGKVDVESVIAEFSDKATSPEITAGMAASLMPEVINAEASIDGGVLKVVAVVDTSVYVATSEDCECIAEPDDDIFCEKKTFTVSSVVAQPTETVYVSDTLYDSKAAEVVGCISRAVVTAAECAEDEVKVSGAVYSTVVTRGDDGMISSARVVTPFIKSLVAQGAGEKSVAFASACVSDAVATLITASDGNSIELSSTLVLSATVVNAEEKLAVTDVFCASSELATGDERISIYSCEPLSTVIDSIDGQVKLEPDRLAADTVCAVTNTFCTVSDSRIEGGRVTVEGLAGGDIIYYNAEKNAVDSVAFRIPFSIPLSLHTDCKNIEVTATVTDVTVRVRRESVFDIKVETAFTVRAFSCAEECVIKSVKKGAEIARPQATVTVHIAKKGETLWQAAKALGCSPESVEKQNPVQAPYAGGERLVNFCGKQ